MVSFDFLGVRSRVVIFFDLVEYRFFRRLFLFRNIGLQFRILIGVWGRLEFEAGTDQRLPDQELIGAMD